MWDVNQRQKTSPQPSLSQWLYQAIADPDVRLRIRLRGNILHILCEGGRAPQQKVLMARLLRAFDSHQERMQWLLQHAREPIYKIIVYGRALGQQKAAWIEPIAIERLQNPAPAAPELDSPTVPLASNESLARMGSTEAIARYLSDSFSHLGISIKTLVQKLPAPPRQDEPAANKRLWVVCNCDYSPDAQLLAEPIAEKLRSLELTGFRDAAIRARVSGETTPEWTLQVDLTHPEILLRDWARWGDDDAIARLLARRLEPRGIQVSAILKDATLHVFCSLLPSQPKEALEASAIKSEVAPLLESLTPQGITAAALYGVEGPKFSLDLPEQPIWVDWLTLPAASTPHLASTPQSLAQQNRLDAIAFILERLLNPDLEHRLATGGLRVKLCLKENILHILAEGLICPPQARILPPLEELWWEMQLPGIIGARIYGRRAGQPLPLWSAKLGSWGDREAMAASTNADSVALDFASPPEPPPLEAGETASSEAPTALPARWAMLRQKAASGLLASKLLIPVEPTDSLSTALHPEETAYAQSSAKGLKTLAIWGAAGLLLVAQTDGLLGQLLKGYEPGASANPAGLELASDASLPELSLQNAPSEQANGFSREGFTRTENRSAATAAILAAARASNPSFNNPLLDEKLALYQERIRTQGVPDVLIVGSSRAMRGIDPAKLQKALGQRGDRTLSVFNFGINGATARVVDLLLRQVLTPEQLPKLIIWADGARAFNSGRSDRTYEAIASSAGYQRLQTGKFPQAGSSGGTTQGLSLGGVNQALKESYQSVDRGLNDALASLSSVYPQREKLYDWLRSRPLSLLPGTGSAPQSAALPDESLNLREAIDIDGFLPLATRFEPNTYYARHPRVAGAYDGDYDSFNVEGEQYEALQNLTQYLDKHQVELVFVNLPLTNIYLDSVRGKYEIEFTARMRQAAARSSLIFRDLGQRWPQEYGLFSDPSHLNRYGADRVSLDLAKDPEIPW